MAKTKADRWRDKHSFFVNEFNTIWEAVQDQRRQAVTDRRFYSIAGAQYEDALGEQFQNTPRFEYNKTHQSVIRIFNEYRANRVSVIFRPEDEDSSVKTAETLTGRYRADEQRSNAQEAYDNGFEEAVGGGMGAFRFAVVADDPDEYDASETDDDTVPVRVGIEPVFDADSSVFFDLDAKRQDKADAKRCYVITSVSRAAYIRDNPGTTVASWAKPTNTVFFDWCTPDVVYVAEVYEIESKQETEHVYQLQVTEQPSEITLSPEEQADEQIVADLLAQGYIYARKEGFKRRKVHKWTMNGAEITDDNGFIPGRCIPVIPVYGKRWFVDNIERFMGQVRLQKDMQRLLNMMISWLAELNSLTPYEVPLLFPEQVAGHADSWATGNIKRAPYRLINPIKNPDGSKAMQGPVATLKPPEVPPGLAALLQVAVAGMDQLGGGGPAQEQDVASQISGKAVELIQKRIDMQSFIYTDNFAKAMRRAGQVWLSMQKDIMPDEEHSAPVVKPDGTQDFVKMVTPGQNTEGQRITENDPRAGKYGCVTDVGPSFTSRRDATVKALIGLLQLVAVSDPQEASVLAASIIMNIDGEGLEDLRKYYRAKLVKIGAVEPTEEEKVQLAEAAKNAKPDPNAEFLLAEARKAMALEGKAKADSLQSLAKAANLQADTILKEEQAHGKKVDTTLAVHAAAQPVPVAPA